MAPRLSIYAPQSRFRCPAAECRLHWSRRLTQSRATAARDSNVGSQRLRAPKCRQQPFCAAHTRPAGSALDRKVRACASTAIPQRRCSRARGNTGLWCRTFSCFPGVCCYLGEVDSEPVTTCLGVTHDPAAGIFNIATPPAQRRRCYGAAVTARAVRDGFSNGARWARCSRAQRISRVRAARLPNNRVVGVLAEVRLTCWLVPREPRSGTGPRTDMCA
jgi:hypothetical protein